VAAGIVGGHHPPHGGPGHRACRPFRRVIGVGGATTVTSSMVIFRQMPSSNRTGKVPCEYSGS